MPNTIKIKRNSSGVPSNGSLDAGELAVNTTDGNLYCGNTAGNGVLHLNPSVGETLTSTGDFTIDSADGIVLDADGGAISLKDNGTRFGIFENSSNHFVIQNPITDADIFLKVKDGSSTITALSIDASDAGAATFNGNLTAQGILNAASINTDLWQGQFRSNTTYYNADTDADDMRRLGFGYYGRSAENPNFPTAYGVIQNFENYPGTMGDGSKYIHQLLFVHATGNSGLKVRDSGGNGTTWTDWYDIWHSGNSFTYDGSTFAFSGIKNLVGTLGTVSFDAAGNGQFFSRNSTSYIQATGGTSSGLNIGGRHSLVIATGDSITERVRINSSGHVSVNSTDLSGYGHFGVAQPAGGVTDGIAVVNGTNSFRLWVDDAGSRRINAGSTSVAEFLPSSFTFLQPVKLGDNVKALFGTGSDLQIYFDGTDGYIKNHVGGALRIRTKGDFTVQTNASDGGATDSIKAVNNAAVELYHAGSKKLETTSTGVTIGSTITLQNSGNVSYIQDSQADLRIESNSMTLRSLSQENYIQCVLNGSVSLYHDSVKKFETTATGGTLSGALTCQGVDVSGSNKISNGDFSNTSNWTIGGGWSLGSGVCSFTDTQNGSIQQASVFATSDSGKTFKLTFTIQVGSSGDAQIWIGNGAGSGSAYTPNNSYYSYGNGTHSVEIVPTDTSISIWGSVDGGNFSIDNISCIEQFGLSNTGAITATSANFSGALTASGTGHLFGKLNVGSVNNSFDFYNNGTSYFNGAVTVDDNLTCDGNLKADYFAFRKGGADIGAYFSLTNQAGDSSSNDLTITAAQSTNSVVLRSSAKIQMYTYASSNWQKRFEITNAGTTTIGGTSSLAQLNIRSSVNGNYLYMDDGSGVLFSISANGSTSGIIQTQGTGFSSWKPMELRANYLQFKPNNSEMMRVNGTGVGISTTSPDSKIHAVTSGTTYAAHFQTSSTTPYGVRINVNSSGTSAGYPLIIAEQNGSQLFRVDSGGVVTFGGVTFPTADGSNGQVLQTNGSGTVTWATAGSGSGSGTVSSSSVTTGTTNGNIAVYTDSTTVKQAPRLFYNGSDHSLTVNKTSPGNENLHVVGDAQITTRLGVGTSPNSSYALHINGASYFSGAAEFYGGIKDGNGSLGTNTHVLHTDGSDVYWAAASGGGGGGGSGVTGSGTDQYIPRWNGTGALEDSNIFSKDGSGPSQRCVGIGTAAPTHLFHVVGNAACFEDAIGTIVLKGTVQGKTLALKSNAGIFQVRDNNNGKEGYHIKFGSGGWHKWFIDHWQEKMVFNSNGLGINTTSPSYKLHVVGGPITAEDGAGTVRLIGTAASGKIIDLKSDGGIFKIRNVSSGNELYHLKTGSSGYHKWYIADSAKMYLSNSGYLGILSTSPSYPLHVVGEAYVSSRMAIATTVDSSYGLKVAGYIASYGHTTWSDYRLKDDTALWDTSEAASLVKMFPFIATSGTTSVKLKKFKTKTGSGS